jgi:hypothetical protein
METNTAFYIALWLCGVMIGFALGLMLGAGPCTGLW